MPLNPSSTEKTNHDPNLPEEIESDSKDVDISWEQQVEAGDRPVAKHRTESVTSPESRTRMQPRAHSVVFLLHSGQPLSYISSLIRAEDPEGLSEESQRSHKKRFDDPIGSSSIAFSLADEVGKRWSPSTGIGDFMREAARVRSFVIRVGNRSISVNVPSFEDRTRFLRATLHAKTREIEHLARLKDTFDREAREATHRMAIGGAGMLGTWWATVGYLTFREHHLFLNISVTKKN